MTNGTDAELWRRAWALCDEAEGTSPAALDAWLAERCGGDVQLELAVRQLLGSGDEPDDGPRVVAAPDTMGPYRLEEPIGSGGMGQVFRARHLELDRVAAVKLLPADVAGVGRAGERFRREARLLARLDHPGIVRVFEAGTGEDVGGRPLAWFAMELVESPRTLTDYVRDERPDAAELLRIFLEVGDAVAHAHASGVLHRDLKPSNLLVDGCGHARVIDFGIGEEAEAGAAGLTRAGSLIGTLNYLAPERLDGERADARSDVYALGLVFEEAVTGAPRFDHPSTGSGLAALREAQGRPAPALESLAAVPPELGWIVAAATDPDPARRYADAAAMAADLRRLQRHEPLVAVPAGRVYRARLFARRNRGLVVAASLVLFTLSLGLVVSTTALVRESDALIREQAAVKQVQTALDGERAALAEAQAAEAEQRREAQANGDLVRFFRGVFERTPARADGEPPYTLDQALDDAWDQSRVVHAQQTDPLLRGRVQALVGAIFARRAQWERAHDLLSEATAEFEGAGAEWTDNWLRCQVDRHLTLVQLGRSDELAALDDRLLNLPAGAAVGDEAWLRALTDLFLQSWRIGRDEDGPRYLETILARADRDDPAQLSLALSATHNLAAAITFDDPERALSLYLEVWAWRSAHEPQFTRTYRSVNGAAEILVTSGRVTEGLGWIDEALALAAANGFAPGDLDLVTLSETRAKGLQGLGRVEEAAAIFERCLARRRELSGDRDSDVLDAMYGLANTYRQLGRFDEALELDRLSYQLRCEEQGPLHMKSLRVLEHMGLVHLDLGEVARGLELLEQAVQGMSETLGPLHHETLLARSDHVYGLAMSGAVPEAIETQRSLLAELEQQGTASAFELGQHLDVLCALLNGTGEYAQAVDAGRRAVELLASLGELRPRLVQARSNLTQALAGAERGVEARAELERALADAAALGIEGPSQALRARVGALAAGE
ncbi:serine/threonine-protein kinase [Engelhardtia mirabilis]|uniref:Serine/threonine-protein kinase PrkC n=1 Tax=Engelhardtia mirabilis TaxID=2528011 RepID=A0A518BSU6_9BACT|nr:Serine/threonine-protein kinase PrkC [Planctomycetes bacterium Pla133]QDV04369.1 Serine/threonine-protein kinase PrkC [Planctomycetes bacterium Pla86]